MSRGREKMDYDVIVVGGGPAGCAFVRSLIKLGSNLRVLLVEKDRFPRDKVCGDGLTYQAIPSIGKIFPELKSLTPSSAFTELQVLWYPPSRRLVREGQMLDVIPRLEFDNALWRATVAAGAETLENAAVTGLLKKDGRVQGVTLRDENGLRDLTCRWLVAADGSRSVVRRETGSTKDDYVIHALRQYVRGIPDSTKGLIFFFDVEDVGYFWIFPFNRNGERWANVGYGNATDNRILKERFSHYCRTAEMQSYLGNGSFEGNPVGFPLNLARFKWTGRLSRPLWGPGYLLLGDAGALIHPLTGEGIAFAIESGRIAAEVLFDNEISPKRKGRVYEQRALRRVRPSFLSLTTFCAIRLPARLPRPLSRALVACAVFAQTIGLGIRPLKRARIHNGHWLDSEARRAQRNVSGAGVRAKTGITLVALLRSIRFGEVILLQGTPLMGVVFSMGAITREKLGLVLFFTIANSLLVTQIFMFNDWAAAAQKAKEPNKATAFVYSGKFSSRLLFFFSVSLLAASLTLFAMLGPKTLMLATGCSMIGIFYSHPWTNFKSMPIASSLAHFIGGLLHFLLGYTLFAPFDDRGLVISFFFALTFTAGHLNHEVHDFDFDRQNNLMTNAVAFGKRPVFIGSFILFTLAYGYVFLIAMQGMVPRFVAILCIALYPLHLINAVSVLRRGLTPDAIRQFRAGYRLIYALIGITILFAVSIR